MKKYDWSRGRVEKAVAEANCWFDCLDKLAVPKIGGNYRTLKGKVAEYNLDISHFDYRLAKTRNGRHYKRKLVNRLPEEIFKYGAQIKTMNLKREYIRRILHGDAHCEICGIRDWNGREHEQRWEERKLLREQRLMERREQRARQDAILSEIRNG